MFCAALLSVACAEKKSIDPAIEAKNAQGFKDCLKDRLGCEGGFVKWSNGPVTMISSCSSNCSVHEMSIMSIAVRMEMKSPWLPSNVDWVALPNDTTVWEKAAVAYARQFVLKK